MSREILFRAWNGKKMLIMGKDGYCDFEIKGGEVFVYCSSGYDCLKRDYPLMQYTGLKDTNGVKIFEGDIVNNWLGAGVVEYIDDCAAYRVNFRNGRAKWFIDYMNSEKPFIKVIGNVHENPELLELTNDQ